MDELEKDAPAGAGDRSPDVAVLNAEHRRTDTSRHETDADELLTDRRRIRDGRAARRVRTAEAMTRHEQPAYRTDESGESSRDVNRRSTADGHRAAGR